MKTTVQNSTASKLNLYVSTFFYPKTKEILTIIHENESEWINDEYRLSTIKV